MNPPLSRSLLTRLVPTVAAASLLVLAGAGAASAHVTVTPSTAPAGGYQLLTFKVPTESDTASTTKLAVYLPTDTPLASVSVQPHAGWSYQVKTTKLTTPITTDDGQVSEAVSQITWTADSAKSAIKPGEFDLFNISAGPLPGSGTLEFKALQTYSDGSVVRWIDDSVPGQPEPDHPAPTLTITAASSGDGGTTDTSTGGTGTSADPSATQTSSGSSKGPWIVSIIALVVAVAGAGVGLSARKRS